MSFLVHHLAGCAPRPLAHYLKALGALRLVATQADPQARGFWRDDSFILVTKLDRAALLDFFLARYEPTPLVAPWNGGSGFYPKDNRAAIDALASARAPRFARYRQAIEQARTAVAGRSESPKDAEKQHLVQRLRQDWSGGELEWLNAAVVLAGEGQLQYPALLGTGGNDGRLDFTNNQMQRLIELIDPGTGAARPEAIPLLELALFGTMTSGLFEDKAIGQFHPGAAGGANATAGFAGTSLINPWDFVLNFEGAVVLQVAAVRRLDGPGLAQASAPFAVRGRAAGYGSAAAADESARGEQWMPLWSKPALFAEVSALFTEGRLQVGVQRARTALEAARALARLGTARGVDAFERYGFIERNGQANLAVPLGRWRVQPDEHAQLLDEVEPWVDRLRRTLSAKGTPASIGSTVRRLEGAMLDVLQHGNLPDAWQDLLGLLGAAEDELARRPKWTAEQKLSPLPPLSPGWLAAAWDNTAELHLAAAIASQYPPPPRKEKPESGERGKDKEARWRRMGPVRANCIPFDTENSWPRFAAGETQLDKAPEVVWRGRGLEIDLAAVAQRRLIDGEHHNIQGFPLEGRYFPTLDDVSCFLLGQTDNVRIARLARGLMAVDWRRKESRELRQRSRERVRPKEERLHALHALIRLCFLPPKPDSAGESLTVRLDDDRMIDLDALRQRPNPAPLRYLLAGRFDAAIESAIHHLSIHGLRPKIRRGYGDPPLAQHLAASLAIPIDPEDLKKLGRLLVIPAAVLSEGHTPAPEETHP